MGRKALDMSRRLFIPEREKKFQQEHRKMYLDLSSSFRNNRWHCLLQFPISRVALFLQANGGRWGVGGGGVCVVLDVSILKWYLAICLQALLP